jgi:hypothetical protein
MNPMLNRGLTAVLPLNKEEETTSKEVDIQNREFTIFGLEVTLFSFTFRVGIYRPK